MDELSVIPVDGELHLCVLVTDNSGGGTRCTRLAGWFVEEISDGRRLWPLVNGDHGELLTLAAVPPLNSGRRTIQPTHWSVHAPNSTPFCDDVSVTGWAREDLYA